MPSGDQSKSPTLKSWPDVCAVPADGRLHRLRDVEREEVDERILAAHDRVVAELLLAVLLLLRLGLGRA